MAQIDLNQYKLKDNLDQYKLPQTSGQVVQDPYSLSSLAKGFLANVISPVTRTATTLYDVGAAAPHIASAVADTLTGSPNTQAEVGKGYAELRPRNLPVVGQTQPIHNLTEGAGEGIKAGLTFGTFGEGSAASNLAETGLGKLSVGALEKNPALLPTAEKLLTVGKGIIPRAVEQAGIGAGFAGGQALSENRLPSKGELAGGATIGAALPIAGLAASTVTNAAGRLIPATARGLMSDFISPRLRDLAYGKDPVKGILDEGIKFSNFEEGAQKVKVAAQKVGKQIGDKIDQVEQTPRDISTVLKPIDTALAKANQLPRVNSSVITRLTELKKDLLGVVVDPKTGTETITRDLSSLTPKQIFDFKKMVADVTKFTGNPSDDKTVNMALKQVYGKTKDVLNKIDPSLIPLNEKYANLRSADTLLTYRDKIPVTFRSAVTAGQRRVVEVASIIGTALSGHLGAAGLGAVGLGADLALDNPKIRTTIANALYKLQPAERSSFLRAYPGMKNIMERIFGKADENLPIAKPPSIGLGIEDVSNKLTPSSQKVVDVFNNSEGQKIIGENNGVKFELGDFGKNHEVRKLDEAKGDRFPSSELPETIKNIDQSFKANNDPKNYRSDNVVHIAEMPNGETRAIITRQNANGAEEIISWHNIDLQKNPNYIKSLESFGSPEGNRTPISALEEQRSNPLSYGTKDNIAQPPNSVNSPKATAPETGFKNFKDLSTKILGKLEGRTEVSKQFISDLTNSGDVKQAEASIIRKTLADFPDKVPVKEFANAVKTELLPLERTELPTSHQKYENIGLPEDQRGPVANYRENIYQSPIKTSAGDVHFDNGQPGAENYFAHTRVEDMAGKNLGENYSDELPKNTISIPGKGAKIFKNDGSTRRVIELQSDLFQKGRLEESKPLMRDYKIPKGVNDANKYIGEQQSQYAKLEPYRNTWQERIVKEEVKQAAKDGKTKLQFPTGETAMKIEGLGQGGDRWFHKTGTGFGAYEKVTPEDLKVGKTISDNASLYGLHDSQAEWVVTDVLGDGKFKAVPKKVYDHILERDNNVKTGEYSPRGYTQEQEIAMARDSLDSSKESFDISGKVDKENPIYKFYDKEVGKYLKNKFGATIVTDPQGVTWNEVPIKKAQAKLPVEAFALAGVGAGIAKALPTKKK